ncbi:MAG: hypothetical protein D6683_17665, partial [Actinomyces sp.]
MDEAAPAQIGENGGAVAAHDPPPLDPSQLMSGHAGDFWLVSGATLKVDPARRDPRIPRHYFRMKDGVEKPIGQWNQYEIICKGDT